MFLPVCHVRCIKFIHSCVCLPCLVITLTLLPRNSVFLCFAFSLAAFMSYPVLYLNCFIHPSCLHFPKLPFCVYTLSLPPLVLSLFSSSHCFCASMLSSFYVSFLSLYFSVLCFSASLCILHLDARCLPSKLMTKEPVPSCK